ncbi:unnamed protein product [Chrysoparadoxa australica]
MESPFWQMVSFYRFASIEDPDNMAGMLQALWRPLEVRGRVYVAKEGINAQMAVPVNVMERFEQATESVPQLNGVFLNKDTQWSKEEFFKGEEKSKRDGQGSPFRRLHVRSRYQIVADGFSEEDALELNANNGTGLTPEEWHEMVDREDTIVLDCRNAYESDVGIFDTAKPLDTAFFRDSWEKLDDILKDTPKDAPVMTYCTGGIRCVKIAAFLEQERGYTNVTRLEGGIISYNKYTKGRGLPSKFAGVNYVFDNRMAERITDDVLTVCEQCNEPWDRHVNCSNDVCHCRFIQCPKCAAKHSGACCNGCSAAVAAENAGEEPPKLWIQPQPFQNSFLNRMLWNVYEEVRRLSRLSLTFLSPPVHAPLRPAMSCPWPLLSPSHLSQRFGRLTLLSPARQLGCASPSSHSTAAEEESAISMITSLGGATRVLVVGDASAAEPIKAELGSDGISIVTVGRDEVAAHLEAMEGEGGDILKDQRQDVIILMDTGGSEMTETVYRLLIEKKALKRQGLLMAPKTTLEGQLNLFYSLFFFSFAHITLCTFLFPLAAGVVWPASPLLLLLSCFLLFIFFVCPSISLTMTYTISTIFVARLPNTGKGSYSGWAAAGEGNSSRRGSGLVCCALQGLRSRLQLFANEGRDHGCCPCMELN